MRLRIMCGVCFGLGSVMKILELLQMYMQLMVYGFQADLAFGLCILHGLAVPF